MRRVGWRIVIASVDDDVKVGPREQRAHIRIENGILDEMIDDVKGESQIERAEVFWESVCQIKTLGEIMPKSRGAPLDRRSRHIDADTFCIPSQFKLGAVTATELYDGTDVFRSDKLVQHRCLELRQLAAGTGS